MLASHEFTGACLVLWFTVKFSTHFSLLSPCRGYLSWHCSAQNWGSSDTGNIFNVCLPTSVLHPRVTIAQLDSLSLMNISSHMSSCLNWCFCKRTVLETPFGTSSLYHASLCFKFLLDNSKFSVITGSVPMIVFALEIAVISVPSCMPLNIFFKSGHIV